MEDSSIQKECTKCKQLLPLDTFAVRKERNGVRRNQCNGCRKKPEYYRNNKEKIQKKNLERYHKNRTAIIAQIRGYQASHKEERRVWRRLYEQNRLKTDPEFKLIFNMRRRIAIALKTHGKGAGTRELLGCSVEFLWAHLESKFQPGMTKENYGKWHIDHIRPVDSFDMSDTAQQRECFHWSNLQPLWAVDNWKKGNKYAPKD